MLAGWAGLRDCSPSAAASFALSLAAPSASYCRYHALLLLANHHPANISFLCIGQKKSNWRGHHLEDFLFTGASFSISPLDGLVVQPAVTELAIWHFLANIRRRSVPSHLSTSVTDSPLFPFNRQLPHDIAASCRLWEQLLHEQCLAQLPLLLVPACPKHLAYANPPTSLWLHTVPLRDDYILPLLSSRPQGRLWSNF